MLRKYEVMYILRHDAPSDVTQAAIDKIKDTITGEGGTILLHESWGKRKLAYEIDKTNKGIYQLTTFAGQASSVKELERVFGIHPQVLRWLTVQLDDKVMDLDAEIEHYSKITPRMDPIDSDDNRDRPAESMSADVKPEKEKGDEPAKEDKEDSGDEPAEEDSGDEPAEEDSGDEPAEEDSGDEPAKEDGGDDVKVDAVKDAPAADAEAKSEPVADEAKASGESEPEQAQDASADESKENDSETDQ